MNCLKLHITIQRAHVCLVCRVLAMGVVVYLSMLRDVLCDSPQATEARVNADPEDAANAVAAWNTACRLAANGSFKGALQHIEPDDRFEASDPHGKIILSCFLLSELPTPWGATVVYSTPDGRSLARLYSDSWKTRVIDGKRVRLRTRTLVATLTRSAGGEWLIDMDAFDHHEFGIGHVVEGLQLRVEPTSQRIHSWDDLRIRVVLESVRTNGVIDVCADPVMVVGENLSLCLISAEPESAKSAFGTWYSEEVEPSFRICGFPEILFVTPDRNLLGPGDRQMHDVTFASLRSTAVPGPTGHFDLYLVYDANLQWDSVARENDGWRHRIASRRFHVHVGGAE